MGWRFYFISSYHILSLVTLTTHSIIAAAVTSPLAHLHPALTFVVALASHYMSDAIPHWDYRLESIGDTENPDRRTWSRSRNTLCRDIARFSADGLLGAGIVLLVTWPVTPREWLWAGSAIVGGSLPDFLQGLYMARARFLKIHQRAHDFMHSDIRLGPYPAIGIPFQLAIAFAALWFLR